MIGCGITLVGFVTGAAGELHYSVLAAFVGVAAAAFVALNSIYVKKCLPIVNNNEWCVCYVCDVIVRYLMMYNASNAMVLLIPFMAITGELFDIPKYDVWGSRTFWTEQFSAGIMGYVTSCVVITLGI